MCHWVVGCEGCYLSIILSQSHGKDRPGAATTLPACVGDVGCAGVNAAVMGEPVLRRGADRGVGWVGGCSEWKSGEGPGPGVDLSAWEGMGAEKGGSRGRERGGERRGDQIL